MNRRRKLKIGAKFFFPPILVYIFRRLLKKSVTFNGPPTNWQSAQKKTTGYDAFIIAEHCLQAAIKVRDAEAAYEQDTVLFDESNIYPPAATALFLAAKQAPNMPLVIFDFGGAMGSLYFRCRPLLQNFIAVRWIIIEQAGLAARGKAHLENPQLIFAHSLEEATYLAGLPSLVIANSVLGYLEYPVPLLQELLSLAAPIFYLDRTIFAEDDVERVFIQYVPPAIYPASYPIRFLSWKKITAIIEVKYEKLCDFDSFEGHIYAGFYPGSYRGGIWKLRDSPPLTQLA